MAGRTQMTGPTNALRTKWDAFKAVVQSTWFWRIYGVCAMKRSWTKLLVAISLFSLMVVIVGGHSVWTPVLELGKMQRIEGVLVKVGYGRRHGTLLVQLESGEMRTYYGDLHFKADKADACLNKQVTIWAQRIYEGWPPFIYDEFQEMKLDGEMMLGYNFERQQQIRTENLIFYRYFFYIFVISILLVGVVCRKGEFIQSKGP
jgi:hypothetical protein